MYFSAPISSRNEFPQLLNQRKLTGEAVEVGTHRADYAAPFLRRWHGRMLHCIDPWTIPIGYEHQAKFLWGGNDRKEDYSTACTNLSQYAGRYLLWKMLSSVAVANFSLASLDFVYIDGDHTYHAVRFDLEVWWPRLKPGGILAGHDWLCPGEEDGSWGRNIQPAVHEFSTERELDVNLVVEHGGLPWSYYIVKK